MILSKQLAGAAGIAGTPIFRRHVGEQLIGPPEGFEPVNNELPGAIGIGINLAFAILRTTAWTIEQLLGTATYGADALENVKHAITTPQAFFGKKPRFFQNANERSVHTGQHRNPGKSAGHHLYAGSTSQG